MARMYLSVAGMGVRGPHDGHGHIHFAGAAVVKAVKHALPLYSLHYCNIISPGFVERFIPTNP